MRSDDGTEQETSEDSTSTVRGAVGAAGTGHRLRQRGRRRCQAACRDSSERGAEMGQGSGPSDRKGGRGDRAVPPGKLPQWTSRVAPSRVPLDTAAVNLGGQLETSGHVKSRVPSGELASKPRDHWGRGPRRGPGCAGAGGPEANEALTARGDRGAQREAFRGARRVCWGGRQTP